MALYFLFSIAVIVGGYVMAKISEYVVAKMGDYLVAPIGDFLVDQLGYLFSYSSNIEDFRKHVEHLKTERDRVQKLVDDAEMSGEDILPIVQTWLTRVNNITEEARNLFNEEPQVNVGCFNGRCPNLKLRYQRSKEAKNKTTEADRLKRDGKFDTVSCPAPPPERISPDAEDFDSRKLISFEIMEALKDDQINMIGVYGIGGVGKTTLVEAVRKQAKDANLFDEVAMASVSQTLSIIKIQDEIADMLGLQLHAKSEKGRAGQLYARLEKKKRILVILDDIWEAVRLEDIGIPSGERHKGCKIVLTSRRLEVCNQMRTQKNFSIEVLPEQEAWNLFRKIVGDSVDSPDLHPLADEVARECAGLPIAIVTIATALANKSLSYWRDSANQLRKSIPDKKVFATLELSYNYLESEEAKSFFLLCCLFPEDSNIPIEYLMRYGMGWGLFQSVDTIDEARERADRLANDLIASCLLQDGWYEDGVRIHDVIRDVGISIASRDKHVFLVRTGPGWKELPREDTFKRYTAISLNSNDIHELPDELECSQLQFLLLECPNSSLQLPNNFFLRMDNLKVLDISAMRLLSLPSSFQYLKNLRTLCLDRCNLKDLSIIRELVKLEILSFLQSDMKELPKEIENLSHLKLLDLTMCGKLTSISPNVIGGLSQLEELYMGGGFIKWEIERQDKERSNASLVELKHLSCLINLEINVPDADLWPEDLVFKNLSRFKISIGGLSGNPRDKYWYPKSFRLKDPRDKYSYSKFLRLKVNLSTLSKKGVHVLLKTVEDLQLTEMKGLKNLHSNLDAGGFQHLRCLYIEKCDEVEHIFNAMDWVSRVAFPVLEKLDLHCLPNMKELSQGQLPSGCFRNLRVVKVFGCKGLKNLFSHSIAKDLSKLVELDVRMCKIMEQIFGNEKEEAAVGTMEFPHLRSLKLLRLPNLRNFCSKMKDDPNSHTEQPLFHKEVALPALEKLEICNGGNFKEIWHPQFLAKSFSQLKSLHVASCKKVLNVIPFNLLPRLQGLERLFVTHCDSVEQIVEVGRLGAGEGHVTGMLSQLRKIVLGKLPKLERMWWWDYPHGTFGFQNLISVRIFKCNGLKNLFSPSIASRLVQLQELSIDSCEMMETIIAEEREEEGEENCIALIAFPQLSGLVLKDLPKLMVFYTGRYTLNFPSLEGLAIQGCHAMKTFSCRTPRPQIRETKDEALDESPEEGNLYISTEPLFNNEVTFPTIQKLCIWRLDNMKDIWHPHLPVESFGQLRELIVRECQKLLNVVPFNLLKGLKNLEEVYVMECDSVEIIFEIEGLGAGTRTLSQLTKLKLEKLPKLREIWSTEAPNESLISLESLSSLHVSKCDSLRNIFSASMAGGLVQLKEGHIFSCEMMEAIVVNEREGESIPIQNIIVFPQLHTLHLHELPNLTTFYTGACTLKWPSLKELFIKTGPRMKSFASRYSIQQNPQMNDKEFGEKPEEYCNSCIPIRSFFEEWVTFPSLQKLGIWGLDNLKEIWHPQLSVDSFYQLRDLIVYDCHKLVNVVPSNLMKDLKNLNEVSVLNCDSVEKIFEIEGLAAGTFSQLSKLRLWNLPKLRDIWSTQDPMESLISLQSLSWLDVDECDTLRNIFSPSIAGDLLQLKKVEIRSCEMVEAIVVTEREGESNPIEIIVFPRLHTLTLETLPNLSSFYTGPSTLKLPSLKALQIVTCPRMKSFASRYPQMNDEEIEGKLEKGSSCIPIRPLFDERAAFTNLEKLCINIANLQEIFHTELPDGSFCQLKFFEVGGCHTLSRVASSNLLPRLKNLQKLSVKECGSVKEIFEVEGLVGEGDISLIQLEEVELRNLTDLRIFCSGNYNFELPSLRRLILEECPKMHTFTSGTLSTPKLNTIKVKDDDVELWEGGLNRTVELLFQKEVALKLENFNGGNFKEIWQHPQFLAQPFSQVKSLHVASCKKVLNFIPFNLLPRLQGLERLLVTDCDSVEQIVEVGRLGAEEGHVTEMLSQLGEIILGKLPKLEHMWWWDYPHGTFGFQNLRGIKIFECSSLKSLFSPSIASSLVQLQELAIDSCEMMERIIAEEREGEENRIKLIAFPQLSGLVLKDLPKLLVFYTGRYTLNFPSLEVLLIQGCPAMKTFSTRTPRPQIRETKDEALDKSPKEGNIYISTQPLFNNEVTFPTIQKLYILRLDNVKDIWHPQLPANSFCQLRKLIVNECQKLLNLVPSNLLKGLKNLEEVNVIECDSMEIIFEIEGLATGTRTLSQLTKLNLKKLPKLRAIWSIEAPNESLINLQSLSSLYVYKCDSLRNIFSASITGGLVQLKEGYIISCEMMEAIVVKEREGESIPKENIIVFPQLHTLQLLELPNLTSFYTGACTLKWPSLKELLIKMCPGMKSFASRYPIQQNPQMNDEEFGEKHEEYCNSCIPIRSFFEEWVTFPTLQTLGIWGLDNLKEIWHPQLSVNSFCQLRDLSVRECHRLLNVVPTNLMKDLKNLNIVCVLNCDSVEIIFEIEGFAAGTFSQLSELRLWKLPKLRDIWLTQDPNESLISLQSLSWLYVDECDTLRNIFSPSIARDLSQLTNVEIGSCEMMEAIVMTKRDGESNPMEIIVFPRLHTLTLRTLPNLSSFYTGPSTLKLPSLKELQIVTCPRMKSFASRYPQMNDEEIEGKLEKGSSCIPIQPLFDERAAFTNLEKLCINIANLQEIFHSELPDGSFCQLKFFEVGGCHTLLRVASSNLLPRLKNLQKLFVKECGLMKEIFEVEGLVGEGDISLIQLEEVELRNLSDLRIFCSGNYNFEFPSLRRLILEECPKMKMFTSGSISSPKLNTIKVKDDDELWEGGLNRTIELLFQKKEISQALQHP